METLRQLVWLASIGLGFLSLVLIAYLAVDKTQAPWPPLERISERLASGSTLIATAIVALVAYLPENPTSIKVISKTIVAPLVLFLIAYLSIRWWRTGKPMSAMLVNGVSLLALSGGLLRMIPANPI